jgi:hypothetical protein
MGDILRSNLTGQLVTSDAPDEPVIIRVVATAQHCSDIPLDTKFDITQLVGCVYSCPLQLDFVQGDVLLDLPALTNQCEEAVVACASTLLH